MKKYLVFCFLICVCVGGIFAQSLQDNAYYKQSLEFTRLAEQALEMGNYDEAREFALKAQENAALSKDYISEMLAAYRARTALNAARARINLADRYNMKTRNANVYNSATALYRQAEGEFNAKDYAQATSDAQRVLALLAEFDAVAGTAAPAAPAQAGQKISSYVVKLNPARRDCLWRIAGYDFVYGDPWKWRHIYEANKAKFPNPNNPALIKPGMVLTIPSIAGEVRSGER
jgi:nucleoid-associated protein YgaU